MDMFVVQAGEAFAQIKIGDEWKEVKQYGPGDYFGERALLRKEPRAASILARSVVTTFKLNHDNYEQLIEQRNLKENLIRKVRKPQSGWMKRGADVSRTDRTPFRCTV